MHTRTLKTIAASVCLVCAGATFCLKSALAQEAGAGAGAVAVAAAAQARDTPLPGTLQAGSGELRFLGMAIYQARLWVSPLFDARDHGMHPLALELTYRRAFSAAAIARRSLEEMQRIGPITAPQATRWQQALQAALPDVQAGDRLVGLYQPGSGATFALNGRTVGTVADPEFARLFFGIWLSPLTSQPGLRTALLGTHAQASAPLQVKAQP